MLAVLVRLAEPVTRSEFAADADVDVKTAGDFLRALCDAGLAEHVGTRPARGLRGRPSDLYAWKGK